MTSDEIRVRDLIIPLHIISLCGGEIHGKARLQKLVFLSQELSLNRFNFDFKAAQFGPLSYKLNDAIEKMKRLGLLEERIEVTFSGNKVICYNLTPDGIEMINLGKMKFLDPEITRANEKVVSQYGEMGHIELLDYVHTQYPEYLA